LLSSRKRPLNSISSKLDNINRNLKKYFTPFLFKPYKQIIIEEKLKIIPSNEQKNLKASAFELITLEEKESWISLYGYKPIFRSDKNK